MKKNKKGFTLAEMLIVVAVIAVLVGIAIPVFTAQLERSREAADIANVRNAYAEVMAEVIEGNEEATRTVFLKQKTDDWQSSDDIVIGGIDKSNTAQWIGIPKKDGTCEVSYSAELGIIFDWDSSSVYADVNTLTSKISGGGLWSSTTYGGKSGESAMYQYLNDVKAALGDDAGLIKIRLGRDSDGSNYVMGLFYTNEEKTTYTFTDGTSTVTGRIEDLEEGSDLYKYYRLTYKNQSKYIGSDYAGWWWK